MEDRYPYLRFVIGAAQLLAGAVALILLLGGIFRACDIGGFAGFVALIAAAIIAGIAWVGAMVWVESLQVFLDIEENTRRLLHHSQEAAPPPPAPPSAGA